MEDFKIIVSKEFPLFIETIRGNFSPICKIGDFILEAELQENGKLKITVNNIAKGVDFLVII